MRLSNLLDSTLSAGMMECAAGHDVKRSVTLEVAGQKFRLKTDAEEAYVRSLAEYVNGKIEEAKQGARAVATQSIALLVALNIADELFQAKDRDAVFRRRVREKSKAILELLRKEADL